MTSWRAFWSGQIAGKVPQVTASFWVIKLLITGMGETTSDFLAHQFDPPVVVPIVGALFLAALIWQVWLPRLQPLVYWLLVVLVSIFGTMVADVIHVAAGVPYAISTLAFASTVIAIFARWYRREGTLDIGTIDTRRREAFYWALVVATFALGTAIGDLAGSSFGLGFLSSAVLFSVVILVPATLYWRSGGTAIAPFWFTYVLTRPVGASFADWMGVGPERGGLGWGTGPVSLTLAGIITIVGMATWIGGRSARSGARVAR